ncbi:hypothetical protein ILYODFUR_002378 [Ilyodon furcidens]|uniref:Uncharacterized protein n=1 Tax=Ilyodon furcidens TaxID=33524 RepID=A0ABV0UDI0_9TELE
MLQMTDGVLGYLLLDPDQRLTELLDSMMCNLVASDGPKHDVLQMFYWIKVRGAWRPDNIINSFIHQELPSYFCHMILITTHCICTIFKITIWGIRGNCTEASCPLGGDT